VVINRHSKESIRKALEDEMKREFTFKPKLIARRKSVSESAGSVLVPVL